jgi:hypothetical protein
LSLLPRNMILSQSLNLCRRSRVDSCYFTWIKSLIYAARQFSFPSLLCSVLLAPHDHVHGKNELLRSGIHVWRALGAVFFWQENHVCKWQEARKEWVLQLFGPKEYSVLLLLLSSMSTCLLVFFYLERIMPLCTSTFICCCLAVYTCFGSAGFIWKEFSWFGAAEVCCLIMEINMHLFCAVPFCCQLHVHGCEDMESFGEKRVMRI